MALSCVLGLLLVIGFASALDPGCRWSPVISKLAISGYNNQWVANKNPDECKAMCEKATNFKCRSIDYYSHWLWGKGCYLSDADRYVAPIVTWTDYTYYEIICDDDPRSRKDCDFIGPLSTIAISGNNLKILSGQTVDQCLQACRAETTFHCKSVDYNRKTRQCLLAIVDRDTVALTSWPDYDYYELSCRPLGCEGGTWQGPIKDLAISGNNIISVYGKTLEECKRMCEEEVRFNCHSIDYFARGATGDCLLQRVTSVEVPLSSWPGYVYYDLSGCNGGQVTTLRTLGCYCVGDPHCYSFDGIRADFMGTCKYTLARDNCKGGMSMGKPTWQVIINPDRNYPSEAVSRVRYVTILLANKDLTIDLLPGPRASVNDVPVYGFPQTPEDGVSIIKTCTSIIVTVKEGIQVTWDGKTRVGVYAPNSYKGSMCGMCGDANGDTSNDWMVGHSDICMDSFPSAKPGQTTSNVNEFGFSWTQSLDSDEKSCIDACPNPPDPDACAASATSQAEAHCAVLKDKTGPFAECLGKLTDAEIMSYFDNCVYDSCHLEDYETIICDHAASMSKVCQLQNEITVTWRTADRCPMECGEGMEYKACGKVCLPTCKDTEGDNCGDTSICEEGCFCKEGLVFDGAGKCITEDECGCKVPDQDNVYVNVGFSYMTEDCGQICTCTKEQGDLECKSNACWATEVCAIKDGVRGCFCAAPCVLDGTACIEYYSPCATSDTAKLNCFSCNAGSEDECTKSGMMKACAQMDAICYRETTQSKKGDIVKVVRGCKSKPECPYKALGRDGSFCEDFKKGTTCTTCHYGDQDVDYMCKEPDPVNVCGLNVDEGKGTQSLTRYTYKALRDKCVEFIYKGLMGNGNNFTTKEKCETACKNAKVPAYCLLEADGGTGSGAYTKRFYFDSKKNVCKKFNYRGEGGNQNNFKTKNECADTCKV